MNLFNLFFGSKGNVQVNPETNNSPQTSQNSSQSKTTEAAHKSLETGALLQQSTESSLQTISAAHSSGKPTAQGLRPSYNYFEQSSYDKDDAIQGSLIIHLPKDGFPIQKAGGIHTYFSDHGFMHYVGQKPEVKDGHLILSANSIMPLPENLYLTGPITDKKAYYLNLLICLTKSKSEITIPIEDQNLFMESAKELKNSLLYYKRNYKDSFSNVKEEFTFQVTINGSSESLANRLLKIEGNDAFETINSQHKASTNDPTSFHSLNIHDLSIEQLGIDLSSPYSLYEAFYKTESNVGSAIALSSQGGQLGPVRAAPPHLQMLSETGLTSRLTTLHKTLILKLIALSDKQMEIGSFSGFNGEMLTLKAEGDKVLIEASKKAPLKELGYEIPSQYSTNKTVAKMIVELHSDGSFTYRAALGEKEETLQDIPFTPEGYNNPLHKLSSTHKNLIKNFNISYSNDFNKKECEQARDSFRDLYCSSLIALIEAHTYLGTLNKTETDLEKLTTQTQHKMSVVSRQLSTIFKDMQGDLQSLVLANPTLVSQDSMITISRKKVTSKELEAYGCREGYLYTFAKKTQDFAGGRGAGSATAKRDTTLFIGTSQQNESYVRLVLDRSDEQSSHMGGAAKNMVSVCEQRGQSPLSYFRTTSEFTHNDFVASMGLDGTSKKTSFETDPAKAAEDLAYVNQVLATNLALLASPNTFQPNKGLNLKGEPLKNQDFLALSVAQGPIQSGAYLQNLRMRYYLREAELRPFFITTGNLFAVAQNSENFYQALGAGNRSRVIE